MHSTVCMLTCKNHVTKNLVFLEELWQYTPPQRDYLADEYKCHHFYSTRPIPAYYVVDIDHITPTGGSSASDDVLDRLR